MSYNVIMRLYIYGKFKSVEIHKLHRIMCKDIENIKSKVFVIFLRIKD